VRGFFLGIGGVLAVVALVVGTSGCAQHIPAPAEGPEVISQDPPLLLYLPHLQALFETSHLVFVGQFVDARGNLVDSRPLPGEERMTRLATVLRFRLVEVINWDERLPQVPVGQDVEVNDDGAGEYQLVPERRVLRVADAQSSERARPTSSTRIGGRGIRGITCASQQSSTSRDASRGCSTHPCRWRSGSPPGRAWMCSGSFDGGPFGSMGWRGAAQAVTLGAR
jgi:hypothetical protein